MGPIELSIVALMATLTSLITMLISTTNFIKVKKNNKYIIRKYEPIELLRYKVISKWNEVESILFGLTDFEGNKYGIRILNILYETKRIEPEDYEKLRKLLQIRNGLVHSNGPEYSPEELLSTLESVDEVITKLTKLTKK